MKVRFPGILTSHIRKPDFFFKEFELFLGYVVE